MPSFSQQQQDLEPALLISARWKEHRLCAEQNKLPSLEAQYVDGILELTIGIS
jgi:hypothetical protein